MASDQSELEPTLTQKDAALIHHNASKVFTPATPIKVRELFAGRKQQITKVLDAVNQPGLHAVLFGERGVGKTSLANVIALIASTETKLVACRINCESSDTFTT